MDKYLKQQDDKDEAAAHDFMERSVMCAEVTLTGATARAIARYISNLEVESDNDLAEIQALCKELMGTSEALVKQNANLKTIIADVKRHTDACTGGVGRFIRERIASFESLPNPRVDLAGASPAQVQRVVGQTE